MISTVSRESAPRSANLASALTWRSGEEGWCQGDVLSIGCFESRSPLWIQSVLPKTCMEGSSKLIFPSESPVTRPKLTTPPETTHLLNIGAQLLGNDHAHVAQDASLVLQSQNVGTQVRPMTACPSLKPGSPDTNPVSEPIYTLTTARQIMRWARKGRTATRGACRQRGKGRFE